MPIKLPCALLLAVSLPLHAQNQSAGTPISPDTQQQMKRLVNTYRGWGEKAGTPGVSVELRPSGHKGNIYQYQMHVTGAPRGKTYTLFALAVTDAAPQQMLEGVTLNAEGVAICDGKEDHCSGNGPDDPIDLTVPDPVKGEPFRYALISTDTAVKAYAKVTPVPLQATDRGCKVQATLLTPGAELVFIEVSGMPPDSEIAMTSDSEGEIVKSTVKADSAGNFSTAILPYKEGLTKGVVKTEYKTATCAPKIAVPWGKKQ